MPENKSNQCSFFDQVLSPQPCLLCQLYPGQPHICAGCSRDLPWLGHCCPRCALPRILDSPHPCGECLQRPPPWQQVIAACHYDFPLNELISRAKYERQLHFIPLLADLLLARLQQLPALPEALIPVPMSRQKLQQRQVNHALLLARQLSKALAIPVLDEQLHKRRDTVQQKDLNRAARQRNLHGSFSLRGPLPASVAIVDDVMTTGATLAEITGLLAGHGVKQCSGWVVARTPESLFAP
ncbi:MAG: ComF family protein [Marinobacterium sp.]|nr:ComF family protein [Marinobacterium sp.]